MNPDRVITVAIADDHQLFRQGLQRLLNDNTGISVCWLAEDGEAVLENMRNDTPDVLLLDIQMQKLDGIGVLKQLQHHHSPVKVIMLSMHIDKPYIEKVHELGALGYLLKNAGEEELLHAIRTVNEGRKYFAADITTVLLDTAPASTAVQLTKRELEVLRLIVQEYSNPDIAEKLFLSIETVSTHRKNLLRKLEVKNTAGLVRYAFQHKLI
jgi:DNA-binding NarL/FixJ family response regulator